MELIRSSGFRIEEHIGRLAHLDSFQKCRCFRIQREQSPSPMDVLVRDMESGPRQSEQFTLTQTACESDIEGRTWELFSCIVVPLDLNQIQTLFCYAMALVLIF